MLKKFINLIKDNIIFIIVVTIFIFLLYFKLPFYIEKDGGLINLDQRIKTSDHFDDSGSLNMAYVSSLDSNLFNLILAKINNWDITNREVKKQENIDYQNKLGLQESINNAMIIAYKKANKNLIIKSNKLIVSYITEEAITDLEIGDEILEIDNQVLNKEEINKYISSLNENDEISIKVINNNKIKKKKAKIIKIKDRLLIGIIISNLKEIDTDIDIDFKAKEAGASGGLMMSLEIYSKLTKQDLTNGKIIAGTGTIDEDGNVGEISGIKYKLAGAVNEKAEIFLVPNNNYKEAINEKEKNNYNIKIYKVNTFDEAIKYLKN